MQAKLKHHELQQSLEAERVAWLNDKKTLEDTIVDMSVLEKHSQGDRTLRENAIQEQEERVKVILSHYRNIIY
jgi:nucleoprotein TPR